MTALTHLYNRAKSRVLATEESLKGKVLRGGVWLGTASFTEQIVRFARSIVLARLLAPQAFGIMAVVLSASTLIHTLTDIGVLEAVVQNPRGAEDEYIDSAFWLGIGRTFMVAAVIFLLAPWMAAFYGNPELTPLLRVASLSVLIDGAWSPRMYAGLKRLSFSRYAAVMHGGGIGGVIITVVLSYFIRDVWALVLGSVAEALVRVSLSFVFYPYLPKLKWHKAAAFDLLHFSKGLFGLSLLNLIFMKTDVFVLAKMYSPAQLGLYSMAIYLVQVPTGFIMNLLGRTMLPTFAHIQGDPERENRILLRITSTIFLLGLPVVVFVYFCGRSVLDVAFGGRYSAAAPALLAASVVSVLGLANGQITSIFYARGAPQMHRTCVLISASTMIVLIYPFAKYFGLPGGQIASFAACAAGYLFQITRIRSLTHLSLSKYFGAFLTALAVSGVLGFALFGVRVSARGDHPILNIAFGVTGCAIAYVFAALFSLRTSAQTA